MKMRKHYVGIGWGENLYDAICKPYSRSSIDPPQIRDWIDDQQKSYMAKDWDHERIYMLAWEMENFELLTLLKEVGVDINLILTHETINRDGLEKLYEKVKTKKDKELIKSLINSFKKDLENKRHGWAYEKASDDFQSCFGDIKEGDDEETAMFFGINLEIDGYEIDDKEYDKSICQFCKNCKEPSPQDDELIKEEFDLDFIEDTEEREAPEVDMFYCLHCNICYQIDKEHMELNNHIPKDEFIAKKLIGGSSKCLMH